MYGLAVAVHKTDIGLALGLKRTISTILVKSCPFSTNHVQLRYAQEATENDWNKFKLVYLRRRC